MRFGGIISLALAGFAACSDWNFEIDDAVVGAEASLLEWNARHTANVQSGLASLDAVSLAKFLSDFNPLLKEFNTVLAALTPENAATEMSKFVDVSKKMGDLAAAAGPGIKSTGPVAISGAFSLLGPGIGFIKEVNQTVRYIVSKRKIILGAHQEGRVKEALNAGREGILAMVVALPTQIPTELKKLIEGILGTKMTFPTDAAALTPTINSAFDFVYKVNWFAHP